MKQPIREEQVQVTSVRLLRILERALAQADLLQGEGFDLPRNFLPAAWPRFLFRRTRPTVMSRTGQNSVRQEGRSRQRRCRRNKLPSRGSVKMSHVFLLRCRAMISLG